MKRRILTVLLAGLVGCASQPHLPQTPVLSEANGLSAYIQGAVAELDGSYGTAQKAYLYSLADDPDNLTLRQRVFQMSLLQGDIPTAVRLAKTLPDNLRNQTMPQLVLAVEAIKRNGLIEAQSYLSRAAVLAPQLLHFTVMKNYLAVAQGRPLIEQINQLKDLKVPSGMAARRSYHVGRMYLKAGQEEQARLALEEASKLEPGTVFTTRLLGELYERRREGAKAREVYVAFRTRNPNVPLFGDAMERLKTSQRPSAFTSTLNDDIAEVLFDFGLLVWVQGADSPARQILNMTLWLNGESDPYATYYAALISEFGEQSDLARTRYERLLEDKRLAVAAAIRLAQMDEAAAKPGAARRRLERLIDRSGTDKSVVERALADLLFGQKQYAAALQYYEKMIPTLESQTPMQQVALLFAYGASHERLKNYDKATAALKRALVLEPANAQILNYLGYMWIERGENLEEGFALLKRASALSPDDGAITDSLGWAYFMRGNTQTALSYLEKAAEQEPDDATVNEHLGDVYAKLGRADEARTQWRLALQLSDEPEQKMRLQLKLKED